MKYRLLILVVLLALSAALVPAAAAQDIADFNCLNLSEADCTIVTTALNNIANMDSFTQSFSFNQSISGADAVVPGMGLDSSTQSQGSGPFVVNREQINGETPYMGVSMAFDVNSQASGGGQEDRAGDVSFVIVDGVFYLKDQETGGWKGAPIDAMMDNHEGAVSMMGMGSTMMTNPAELDEIRVFDINLVDLLQTPGFLSQSRLADESVDGQTMAVFAFSGDLAVLLQDEDVQAALGTVLAEAMSGSSGSGMSGQFAMMMPVILESTTGTVTVTRWIGADDGFAHRIAINLDAAIDLFGGSTATNATPIPPILVNVNLTVDIAGINDTAAPTAPADAVMVTPEELMPMPEATPEG
ncbi:MAG: hypothetical protein JNJ61_10240 [Anaerolineae bacterium]|nr:hypothetical protein [Anaerolineae bacterium]